MKAGGTATHPGENDVRSRRAQRHPAHFPAGQRCRWVIWHNPGGNQPDFRDRIGTAPTLSLAMTAVQHSLKAAFSRAIAYD